jgi:predicted MFS family arabinose efflux permease
MDATMALHPELIWIKSIHFLSCLSSVAWGRYQVVYLNSLGIAPSAIGALRAAGLAAKFVAIPLWGAWADAAPASTTPLLAALASTAALIHLYRAPTVVGTLPLLFLLKMARSAANGVGTLVDGLTLRVLERHPRAGYGAQRLWTGAAWGGGSYVAGAVIDARGYAMIFPWTVGFSAVVAAVVLARPAAPPAPGKAPPSAPAPLALGALRAFRDRCARQSGLRPFLLLMALYGVSMSLVEALLFLQMARDFGSSARLMGAVTLVGTLTEFPLFAHSDGLIARHGPVRMLRVAHACLAGRLMALACVTRATAPWALPLLQLLHGPCFALAWSAAVSFAAAATPPRLRATSQSALSTAYYVLGAGVGSALWSCAYEYLGARATYLSGAALIAASAATLLPRLEGDFKNEDDDGEP